MALSKNYKVAVPSARTCAGSLFKGGFEPPCFPPRERYKHTYPQKLNPEDAGQDRISRLEIRYVYRDF
jgi:hypothetical protein